jgi:hypothetical protein
MTMSWLGIAWGTISYGNWGSLILMLAAVGIFGQYMLQKYAHRPRTLDNKGIFVREGRLRLACIVFGCGLGLQILIIILASVLPGRG